MKRLLFISFLLLYFLPSRHVEAAGYFLTNKYMDVAITGSKNVVIYQDGMETLFTAAAINFNPLTLWNFAWIIPVPARPEVKIVRGDIFSNLESELDGNDSGSGENDNRKIKRQISIMETKVYDFKNERAEFEKWMNDYAYLIPKRLSPLLDEYERKGWFIVSAHVDGLHIQSTGLENYTLYSGMTLPLSIKFQTDKPFVPLKIMSIVQDVDSEAIPFSQYNISSEEIIGKSDTEIDALAKKPSRNLYPRLPLDSLNVKLDFYLIDFEKEIDFGDARLVNEKNINGELFSKKSWNGSYLDLAPRDVNLKHYELFRESSMLEDFWLDEKAEENKISASAVVFESTRKTHAKNGIFALFAVFFGYYAFRKVKTGKKV